MVTTEPHSSAAWEVLGPRHSAPPVPVARAGATAASAATVVAASTDAMARRGGIGMGGLLGTADGLLEQANQS